MNFFDDDKIYGASYVMVEGFPRTLTEEEKAMFNPEVKIAQGTYHKCAQFYFKNIPGAYVPYDLSKQCEATSVVGSTVDINNVLLMILHKPSDPSAKPIKRVMIK